MPYRLFVRRSTHPSFTLSASSSVSNSSSCANRRTDARTVTLFTRAVGITLVVDNRLFSVAIIFHASDPLSILLDKQEGLVKDLLLVCLSPDTVLTDMPFFFLRNEPVGSLYSFYEPLCASDFCVA